MMCFFAMREGKAWPQTPLWCGTGIGASPGKGFGARWAMDGREKRLEETRVHEK